MNVLTPHQNGTVLTLLQNQVSQHEICRKTGIDRKTIRKLAQAMATSSAGADSNSPTPATGPPKLPGQIPPPRPPAIEPLAPASAKLAVPKHARSACEPHREWIEAQVHLGRNAMAIYQELVDQRGFQLRYNSVKRFCRALRKREPEQFDRLEFLPGE